MCRCDWKCRCLCQKRKNAQLILLPDWSERADVIEGDAGGGLGESNDIIASEMIGWYC